MQEDDHQTFTSWNTVRWDQTKKKVFSVHFSLGLTLTHSTAGSMLWVLLEWFEVLWTMDNTVSWRPETRRGSCTRLELLICLTWDLSVRPYVRASWNSNRAAVWTCGGVDETRIQQWAETICCYFIFSTLSWIHWHRRWQQCDVWAESLFLGRFRDSLMLFCN